jgi:hypothetical protein
MAKAEFGRRQRIDGICLLSMGGVDLLKEEAENIEARAAARYTVYGR